MCTRDKNLIGLQSDLLASEAMGLRNILMITGDPPKVGQIPFGDRGFRRGFGGASQTGFQAQPGWI
jgi:5,10-methylenetetrahydrofolate reductase